MYEMTDNNLRISFDYKYPDVAALVVYSTFGDSPEVNINKVITGEEAVKLYSMLTGKTIENVHKEAGYTKFDGQY
jgi:hypothetical protein